MDEILGKLAAHPESGNWKIHFKALDSFRIMNKYY